MRYKLARFFKGRNGIDNLSIFMLWVSIAALLLSSLLSGVLGGIPSAVLWIVAIFGIVFGYSRAMSRNLNKRREENQRYLRRTAKVRGRINDRRLRFAQRREYKFFKCPSCKAVLRVPKGKGVIQIICSKCGERFKRKS